VSELAHQLPFRRAQGENALLAVIRLRSIRGRADVGQLALLYSGFTAPGGRIPGGCREVYGSKLHMSVLPKSDIPCNVTCNLIASVASWIYQ